MRAGQIPKVLINLPRSKYEIEMIKEDRRACGVVIESCFEEVLTLETLLSASQDEDDDDTLTSASDEEDEEE